jgi:outer membrane protein assembly factor BamB
MRKPANTRTTCAAAALACCFTSGATAGENWPQFRGPGARGVSEETNLPTAWSPTENVSWKRDLPGRGWSSPLVWRDRVFLTTVVNEGETEQPKKGLYFGGNRPDVPTTLHRWKVCCLDLHTGRPIWEKVAHEGVPKSPLHLKNSYAAETPVTDGDHLYAYFGNLGIFCYDIEGEQVWSRAWPVVTMRYGWGTATSPVLYKECLYLVNDNEDNSWLVALDKRTGKDIWKVDRDEKSNWATPYIWENRLRTEIVTPGTGKVRSCDLNGNLLYEFGGMSSITTATPYSKFGLLYISSGYVLDKKRPLFAIRPGADGDITLEDDQTSNDYIAWCQKQSGPYIPSTVVYGDLLYVLLDRGFLVCYDAKTGEPVYGKKRLPNGRRFTASPWAYGGNLFCINEDGVTFVVKAGRDFELLRTNPLGDDDMCMATPAIVSGKLLIRTSSRIYCLHADGE